MTLLVTPYGLWIKADTQKKKLFASVYSLRTSGKMLAFIGFFQILSREDQCLLIGWRQKCMCVQLGTNWMLSISALRCCSGRIGGGGGGKLPPCVLGYIYFQCFTEETIFINSTDLYDFMLHWVQEKKRNLCSLSVRPIVFFHPSYINHNTYQ